MTWKREAISNAGSAFDWPRDTNIAKGGAYVVNLNEYESKGRNFGFNVCKW